MEGDPLDVLRALLDSATTAVRGWLWGTSAGTRGLELAVRGSNDGLFVMDPATRMIECWPRYLELLGYADHPDELPRSLDAQAELLHPDDRARATFAVENAVATGTPFDAEYRARRRDGAYRWFHGRGRRVVDASGRVLFAGCLTDISEHKRQAQLMEQSSAAAHVGGWEIDCVTQTLFWTPETYRINETSPEAYTPSLATSARFFTPKSLQVIDAAARRAVRDGVPWDLELEAVTARGRRIAVRSTGVAEREGGRTTRLYGSIQDVTDQKAASQALRESEEKLRAILEHASVTVFWGTPDGVFHYVSPPVQKMTGFTPEEYVGRSYTTFMHEEDVAANLPVVERVLRGLQIQATIDYRSRHKSGGWRWHSASISRTGDRLGIIGVSRDTTALREAEAERVRLLAREQAARTEAEEANRLKDEFLATVSHELRTPLGPIVAWADLLSEGALAPDEQREALAAIRRNARIQARLIEDLLDVSRITSGNLRMQVATIDLPGVIDAALDSVRLAAEAKSIRLTTRYDGATAAISGDATRLQQILWNLLSNAIKFTPAGGAVEVAVHPAGARVVIAVRDTGEGIDAEFLPYVFERFRQGDGSATRARGGLGLGLSIVRHLVELHGGRVRAESAGPAQGSTFAVELPVATPAR